VLGGWDHPDGLEEAAVVEPVDPLEHGELDVVDRSPGAASADDLGLEQADHGFGQRVVEGVADRADRGFDSGLGEPLGVANGEVLTATVAVMDQPRVPAGLAVVDGLLERVQREVGPKVG